MVRRLIVMVDDHEADATEEEDAIKRTYPATPLAVLFKICGRCDFLEEHTFHKFLHEEWSASKRIRMRSRSEWFKHSGIGQAARVLHKPLDVDLAHGCSIGPRSSARDEPDECGKAKNGESANEPEPFHSALQLSRC